MSASSISDRPSALPTYDSQSFGYKLLRAVSEGKITELSELIQLNPSDAKLEVGRLQCVQKEPPAYYTPLHYALAKTKWVAAALLLNLDVSWDVQCIRKDGTIGKSPIQVINENPVRLTNMLRALKNSDESINVEALINFLTSRDLSRDAKFEIVKNYQLRTGLCAKVEPEEALFLMASLSVGSFQWEGGLSDFQHFVSTANYNDFLEPEKTLSCSQFLLYSSFLTGLQTMDQIVTLTMNPMEPFINKAIRKNRLSISAEDGGYMMRLHTNRTIAKNLGLVRNDNNLLNLNERVDSLQINVFYCVADNKNVGHYGLIAFFPNRKPQILHISDETKEKKVAYEPADVFFKPSIQNFKPYISMLPWHVSFKGFLLAKNRENKPTL